LALQALLEKHAQTVYYLVPHEKVDTMEALNECSLTVTDEFTGRTAPLSFL
jgi:hypothetical protein